MMFHGAFPIRHACASADVHFITVHFKLAHGVEWLPFSFDIYTRMAFI